MKLLRIATWIFIIIGFVLMPINLLLGLLVIAFTFLVVFLLNYKKIGDNSKKLEELLLEYKSIYTIEAEGQEIKQSSDPETKKFIEAIESSKIHFPLKYDSILTGIDAFLTKKKYVMVRLIDDEKVNVDDLLKELSSNVNMAKNIKDSHSKDFLMFLYKSGRSEVHRYVGKVSKRVIDIEINNEDIGKIIVS